MRRYIILILVFSIECKGQIFLNSDPRSESRGNTTSLEEGSGSVLVNPAGNANQESFEVIIAGHNTAGLEGLSAATIGVSSPTKLGTLSLVFGNIGDKYLSQSHFALNWAQKLGIAQLGLRPSVVQTRMQGSRSVYLFLLDFSGIVKLTPALSISAGINNLTQAKYSDEDKVPVSGYVGLGLAPVKPFFIVIEVNKDLTEKPEYKFGCSYLIKDKFEVLTGITTQPLRQTFGIGLILKKFRTHWSYTNLPGFGSRMALSLIFRVSRKNA